MMKERAARLRPWVERGGNSANAGMRQGKSGEISGDLLIPPLRFLIHRNYRSVRTRILFGLERREYASGAPVTSLRGGRWFAGLS